MKVICECGCNWHDIEEAEAMINRAKDVGCWAAKFQLFSFDYAEKNNIPSYLSISKEDAELLFTHGQFRDIEVFFTPFDVERVQWCEDIGVNYYKIRFKDWKENNYELIGKIFEQEKPVFISMNKPVLPRPPHKFLYCVPKYPASYLDYMTPTNPYYRNLSFKGVSDHTPDLELFLKHSKGYKYWEKHVCLTKECLEAEWSCTFEELREVLQK